MFGIFVHYSTRPIYDVSISLFCWSLSVDIFNILPGFLGQPHLNWYLAKKNSSWLRNENLTAKWHSIYTIVHVNESNKVLQTESVNHGAAGCRQLNEQDFCVRKRKELFSRTQKIVRLNISTQRKKLTLSIRSSDGSKKSTSFFKVHVICTYEKSLL